MIRSSDRRLLTVEDSLRREAVGQQGRYATMGKARLLHDFLVWVWEMIRPYVIVAGKAALVGAGVLYRRISLFIDECNRATANS